MSSDNQSIVHIFAATSIKGTAGDDHFEAPATSSTIDGLAGTDDVTFRQSFASYSWIVTSDSTRTPVMIVTDRVTGVAITLKNIELLKFADISIGLRLGSNYADTLLGTTGPDILFGGDDHDLIKGSMGSDTLWGGLGNDTLEGDDGNDVLGGNSGDDILNGGDSEDLATYYNATTSITVGLSKGIAVGADSGTDTLISIEDVEGSNFDDRIVGGLGDNFLIGRLGNDTLDGGANDNAYSADYAHYGYSLYAVWASLAAGRAEVYNGNILIEADTLLNLEGLSGSSYGDYLIGDDNENYLRGNLGDDTLDGGAGTDWALYNRANGAVSVNLAQGSASGADGNDTLISIENIRGSAFDDYLVGNSEENMFRGLGGNDTIDGGDGFDWADYRQANNGVIVDLYRGTTYSNSQTSDSDGTDTLINIEGARGSMFDDAFYGGQGHNRFRGLKGNDTLYGWDGSDEADYSQDARFGGMQGIVANLNRFDLSAGRLPYGIPGSVPYAVKAGTVRDGFGTIDTLSGISAIRGSVFGDFIVGSENNETLMTDDGDDTIGSGGGADRIDAGAGNDMIFVGLGGETVDGGEGNDIVYMDNGWRLYRFSEIARYLTRDSAGTVFIALPGRTITELRNIEQLGFAEGVLDLTTWDGGGTPFDDVLQGTSGNDTIFGREGNDVIRGNGGNDYLDGGSGGDWIVAGNGSSATNLILNGSFENYTCYRGQHIYASSGYGWLLQSGEIEICNTYAGKSASQGDKFVELDARFNDDAITQYVDGLVVNEYYYLSFDFSALMSTDKSAPLSLKGDTVSLTWNDSTQFFFSNTKSWQNFGMVVQARGHDMLRFAEFSIENDGFGVHLDNISLTKCSPLEVTTLVGGKGLDTLEGGMGADRFVFATGDTGATLETADVIRNFQTGLDVVDVRGMASNKTWMFSGTTFKGKKGGAEIIWRAVTGGVLASMDVNNDKKADYALFFEGKRSLSAQDFGL